MKKACLYAVALAFGLAATQSVLADSISISATARPVSDVEAGGGAPAGGTVYEFFATTDGDILAVNFVTTEADAEFYQNQFGANNAPPNAALIPVFPSLTADTWITTPGDTSVLGGGFPNNGDDTYGDTSNNGPQDNFKFAVLTLPAGAKGRFAGQFDIAGTSGVYSQMFSIDMPLVPAIPEPASALLMGTALIGFAFRRR